MSNDLQIAKVALGDKLVGKVVEAWKVGKTALAALVIGTICILSAFAISIIRPEEAWVAIIFLLMELLS